MSREGPKVHYFPKKTQNYTADELARQQIVTSYKQAYPVIAAASEQLRALMVHNKQQHVVDGILRAHLGVAVMIIKQNGASIKDLQDLLANEVWDTIQLQPATEAALDEAAPLEKKLVVAAKEEPSSES